MPEDLSLGAKAGELEVSQIESSQPAVLPTLSREEQQEVLDITQSDFNRGIDATVNTATDFIVGTQKIGEEAFLATQQQYMRDYWDSLSLQEQNTAVGGLSEIFREANRETDVRRVAREKFTGEADGYFLIGDVVKFVGPSMGLKLLGKVGTLSGALKAGLSTAAFEFGLSHVVNESDDAVQNAVLAGGAGSLLKVRVNRQYMQETISNTTKAMSNGQANVRAAVNKASAITGTGSILGLGAVIAPTDAEGSVFSSLTKLAVKSTDDVETVMKSNFDTYGDQQFALRQTEKDLVPSLSDYQVVSKRDMLHQFTKSIGYEVNSAFRRTDVNNAIDDIVNQSTLLEKNAPLEVESILRQDIEDILPAGVGRNDQIRSSLGHVFRTGARRDDIDAFFRGSNINRDLAMSNLVNRVDDIDMTKLNNAIEDIANNLSDKSIRTPVGKNSITVLKNLGLDTSLSKHVDDLIIARGLSKLPQGVIDDLFKIRQTNKRSVDNIFGFREALNTKTRRLIDAGDLREADADFAFSSSTYNNVDKATRKAIVSADEMKQIDNVQLMSKTLNRIFKNNNLRLISKKKLEDGTYEVEIANRNDFVQGPVLARTEKARSAVDNKLQDPVPVQSHTGSIPTRVIADLKVNGQNIPSKSMEFQKYRATLDDLRAKGMRIDEDKTMVTHSAKPLSREEQEFLGLSDDIADVASKTAADVQRQLGTEAMYSRVKREYSTSLDADNADNFIANFSTKPEFLFVSTSDQAIKNSELVQTLSNNYIRIDDPVMRVKTSSDYVSKEHAFTLMGYQKMYATQYTYSMSRFVENMHRDLVSTFRSSVVLKNPVSMVNNVVSMAFSNFSYQYMTKGKLSGKAFNGLTGSYKGYKKFVNDRATLMNMKASGASDVAMSAYRVSNLDGTPSYELYKRGGLQSLLDDGLADRSVRNDTSLGKVEHGVRSIFLAEDTTAGQVARKISDMGDITNRVNMFDELVKDGMPLDNAAREVQKMAVNYSRVLSPSFNFGRETGITPFITWYSRFLPQFANVVADNPMRSAKLQGMYLGMQSIAGSEDVHGNNYIGGVNVNNWWAFNSFNPDSLGDVFNGPVTGFATGNFGAHTLVPAHINQLAEGRPRLVTTQ